MVLTRLPLPSLCALFAAALLLGGCGLFSDRERDPLRGAGQDFTVFDSGGQTVATGITVNSYLWRASLDTLSFMPLVSADPFGGTIITDWYSPPGQPDERFKVDAYILSPTLRADGLRVTVFRQVRDNAGAWVDAVASDETAGALSRTILTRARQIRIAQLNAE